MKNLENFGVLELSSKEVQEIGGALWIGPNWSRLTGAVVHAATDFAIGALSRFNEYR